MKSDGGRCLQKRGVMSRKSKALEFASDVYDIQVTGRHVSVTQSMKDYALEKASKLDKFSDRIIDANIIMDIQKLDHKVEIILKVNNFRIVSSASTTDMYASIDLAMEKMERQLLKYKEKLNNHQTKGVPEIDMTVNVIRPHQSDEVEDVNLEIEEENTKRLVKSYSPHQLVAKEKMPLKVLNLDEAIMKMELSQDIFLIFKCEEDKTIKVMYRRKDGNFGLIEPR